MTQSQPDLTVYELLDRIISAIRPSAVEDNSAGDLLYVLRDEAEAFVASLRKPLFPIGTQFMSGGKNPRLCTVVDYQRTTNSVGIEVKFRYVAYHEFMGNKVFDYDICETSVAIGVDKLKNAS